jgi:TorA maturation chaperone TorD
LYTFGAQVVLRGLTPDTWEAAAILGVQVPVQRDPTAEDALAAAHVAVFGRSAPPYPSVWLGEDALMGGPVAAAAADLWARCGLPGAPADVEPDHLGVALRALGFLCLAEADARRDGLDPARILDLEREVVRTALLPAWCGFAAAVEAAGDARFGTVMALVGEALAGHAVDLRASVAETPLVQLDLLDDPKTGLRQVAGWLTTPARAGGWLSTSQIDQIAAAAGVPRGFGSRADMTLSLLFAAVDRGTLPEALDGARTLVDGWDARYASAEALGLPAAHWRGRVRATRDLLTRLRDAASRLADTL